MRGERINLSVSSMQKSLEAIYSGHAGLNSRRKSMLERVPNANDWAVFEVNKIQIKDIAYLSAATGHEFALLRGKTQDILFHGIKDHCYFSNELLELLKKQKLRLVAHSHPDCDKIIPSKDDRDFLRYIHQEQSVIISYVTGKEIIFNASMFDFLGGESDA